jgi:hypothetical protein
MQYETPTIEVVGTATKLIQGTMIPGNDQGVGNFHSPGLSSRLEEQ